jgi:pantetheine-phosphate adenylyltransferase
VGRTYSRVATGGTFDRLHAGHRRLLERSFEVGDEVVIGLTSDEFARREGKRPKRSYRQRAAGLDAYLRRNFPGRRYAITRLDDYFGPGVASAEVEALVASPETGKRVELANGLRAERGFPPLELVVIDWVASEDGRPISSTRITRGEIDEEGRLLLSAPPASKATAGKSKRKQQKEKDEKKEKEVAGRNGTTTAAPRRDEKGVSGGGIQRRRRKTRGDVARC